MNHSAFIGVVGSVILLCASGGCSRSYISIDQRLARAEVLCDSEYEVQHKRLLVHIENIGQEVVSIKAVDWIVERVNSTALVRECTRRLWLTSGYENKPTLLIHTRTSTITHYADSEYKPYGAIWISPGGLATIAIGLDPREHFKGESDFRIHARIAYGVIPWPDGSVMAHDDLMKSINNHAWKTARSEPATVNFGTEAGSSKP
jgi:hypothetical protein